MSSLRQTRRVVLGHDRHDVIGDHLLAANPQDEHVVGPTKSTKDVQDGFETFSHDAPNVFENRGIGSGESSKIGGDKLQEVGHSPTTPRRPLLST